MRLHLRQTTAPRYEGKLTKPIMRKRTIVITPITTVAFVVIVVFLAISTRRRIAILAMMIFATMNVIAMCMSFNSHMEVSELFDTHRRCLL